MDETNLFEQIVTSNNLDCIEIGITIIKIGLLFIGSLLTLYNLIIVNIGEVSIIMMVQCEQLHEKPQFVSQLGFEHG